MYMGRSTHSGFVAQESAVFDNARLVIEINICDKQQQPTYISNTNNSEPLLAFAKSITYVDKA